MSQVKHHIDVKGREYWRSFEELAGAPEVREALESEFVRYDPDALRSMSRRKFLRLMGASLALAGLTLTGCRRWPKEKLAPYASRPDGRTPGIPEQYATVMELDGVGVGLLATCYDGRPIKIEGNPTHPFSRSLNPAIGAADAHAQASVLDLYDPDRARDVILRGGEAPSRSDWEAFGAFASRHFAALKPGGGAGFAVLCEASSSPSVHAMRDALLAAYPQAKWVEYSPINRDNEIEGAKLAFGQAARGLLHLDKALIVASFDADLLGSHPAQLRHSADWAALRKSADHGMMNRVYVAESVMSITGSVADRRVPARPSRVETLVRALAAKLGIVGVQEPAGLAEAEAKFIAELSADLSAGNGRGVVAAGAHLPPQVHALVHAINLKIGAAGKTITYVEEPTAKRPTQAEGIAALAADMHAGRVNTLLILGGNPAYDAPADLDFAKALAKVPVGIRLGHYHDETSALCTWSLPRAHYLEAWGDARAWDGTISVAQPMIRPLYNGRSIIELLSMLLGEAAPDGEQIVRKTVGLADVTKEKDWRRVLHDGVMEGSAWKAIEPAIRISAFPPSGAMQAPADAMEVRFVQASGVHDGRYANNGWLQELPDPLTKLTWDNAALLSKGDADRLGLGSGDLATIDAGGRTVTLPVYVMAGQPAGAVTVALGYGRTHSGAVGQGVGVNTYAIRTSQAMGSVAAKVSATAGQHKLALTQGHHLIDDVGTEAMKERIGEKGQSGEIVREATFERYKADRKAFQPAAHGGGVALQLFEPPSKFNAPHAWGMAVDMTACTGCSACVVACQAENNVPVVGREQVLMSREMHWLRIDRYFKGVADDPSPGVVHQPVMCVHCENAPCEQVCPVAATVHDSEGLNTMVYNRCIGTRYCSNNCPYKVRRFNYFDFHAKDPRGTVKPWLNMPDLQQREEVDAVKSLAFNPEVTVRMRGVMEKCTYCVQRIHSAASARRVKGEEVRDGDVVTACQQSCPTQAIVFGNLNDPESKVSRLHRSNRAYGVLDAHLNTRPRTRHLGLVRNPPPAGDLAAGAHASEDKA